MDVGGGTHESSKYREKEIQRERNGSSQDLAIFIISIINNRHISSCDQ